MTMRQNVACRRVENHVFHANIPVMDTLPRRLARKNLLQLWWLRNIAIGCEALVLSFAAFVLDVALPIPTMAAILLGQGVVNTAVGWRLRLEKPVHSCWVLLPLLCDVLALFTLLALSGGATNPFTSLFVLQVILAATLLPPRQTWQVTAAAIACYTLLFALQPRMENHSHTGHGGSTFDLHVYGMWGCFVILALLVAWFVTRMQATIHRQNQLLAASEQWTVLGTIATSAAHELGTPLSSIALLTESIGEENISPKDRARQVSLLRGQIIRCKEIVSQMALKAGVMRAESGHSIPARHWLDELCQRWQAQHPEVPLYLNLPAELNATIVAEYTLEQAILNLLDNAADSSPQGFSVTAAQDRSALHLHIEDEGEGFPEALLQADALHQPSGTSKPGGMGMGLYLSHMVATRLGGTLRLQNRPQGGAHASLSLPLAEITP